MRAEISLRKDSARMFIYMSLQKEIQRFDDFNSVLCLRKITLQGNDNFFVAVPDSVQRCKLPLSRFRHVYGFCNLNIFLLVCFGGNKVNLLPVDFTDVDVITAAQKFKVDNILQNMSAVTVTIAQQVIPQANVCNIIFAEGAQIILALYVKTLDFTEDIGFCQCFDICLNCLPAGFVFRELLVRRPSSIRVFPMEVAEVILPILSARNKMIFLGNTGSVMFL